MQNRIKICTILFCWLSASIVFAQNDPADISEKLKILEGHQKNLEESYQNKLDDLTRKFELNQQAADLKLREMETYQKNTDDRFAIGFERVNSRVLFMELIMGFLGVATLGGVIFFVVGYFKLKKQVYAYADQKAREMFEARFQADFERLFNDNKDKIEAIIRLNDNDLQLKMTKTIRVLSKDDADNEFLKNFFCEMKFDNVDYGVFDPSQTYSNYDLILFNNEPGLMDSNEIVEYAKTKIPRNKIFFYFGFIRIDDEGLKKNFASATFRTQLYGNIMNALRHHSVIREQRPSHDITAS